MTISFVLSAIVLWDCMTSENFQGSSKSDYFSVMVENLYIVSPLVQLGCSRRAYYSGGIK